MKCIGNHTTLLNSTHRTSTRNTCTLCPSGRSASLIRRCAIFGRSVARRGCVQHRFKTGARWRADGGTARFRSPAAAAADSSAAVAQRCLVGHFIDGRLYMMREVAGWADDGCFERRCRWCSSGQWECVQWYALHPSSIDLRAITAGCAHISENVYDGRGRCLFCAYIDWLWSAKKQNLKIIKNVLVYTLYVFQRLSIRKAT